MGWRRCGFGDRRTTSARGGCHAVIDLVQRGRHGARGDDAGNPKSHPTDETTSPLEQRPSSTNDSATRLVSVCSGATLRAVRGEGSSSASR
jgi:hypothetical protein